ncbi:hypothetical protein D3C81_797670 [compost metagenome]
MADGDRPAIDVQALGRNAQGVTAIQHLAGERFVQLPQADVVHGQAMTLEQFRNRVDRADAHLVGIAAGDGHAAIDPQRFQATFLGHFRAHQHRGRRTVGQLRGVAGGDETPLVAPLTARPHWLQRLQALESGVDAVALIAQQGDGFITGFAGGLVEQCLAAGQRRELPVEASGALGLCGTQLALVAVFVLLVAGDAVARGDDLGGFDHRDVGVRVQLDHRTRLIAIQVLVLVLHQGNRLQATGHGDVDFVAHDALGGHGDTHQARRALALDGHPGHRCRQAAGNRAQTPQVIGLRTLLRGGADDHVVHFTRLDAGTAHGFAHHVAAQLRRFGVIERTAKGFADRCAGGGNDDGFFHAGFLENAVEGQAG